jgi:hypothetical protein
MFIVLGAVVVALLFLSFCREERKAPVEIVVPHAQIERLQKENDKKMEEVFKDADERRRLVDDKVREASVKPSPKVNVTAKQLEEKAK